jgi:hypothetical protein
MNTAKFTKKKRLKIDIEFLDFFELKSILLEIDKQVKEGVEFNESAYTEKNSSYSFYFEYIDKSDFTEKEIDGKLTLIYKSRINEID